MRKTYVCSEDLTGSVYSFHSQTLKLYNVSTPNHGRNCGPLDDERFTRQKVKSSNRETSKGRSVETALHEPVHHIVESYKGTDYALRFFIDIVRVFNNMKTGTFFQSLEHFEVIRGLTNMIDHILRNR